MRKIIAVILSVVMSISSFATFGMVSFADENKEYSVGDYITFGSYPYFRVYDKTTLSELNSLAVEWNSYGYYSGDGTDDSMKSSDFMRYCDVKYGDNKYRGVVFDAYRPSSTGGKTSTYDSYDASYQAKSGYIYGNVYWFEYKPLRWRILDINTGLVMCSTIIDSQPFNNYCVTNGKDSHGDQAWWGNSAQTYYASDYANSSIRKWLNEDFYITAFSDDQQSNIKTTKLNNYGYYTLIDKAGYEDYDSTSTDDRVFLPSYNDVLNDNYGFSTSYRSDTARQAEGSDYAKCQGLYPWGQTSIGPDSCYFWWLRSPGIGSNASCYVTVQGDVLYDLGVDFTWCGIRPAMCLSELKSDYTENEIDSTEYSPGYEFRKDTYSFENFDDFHCKHKGHCFGMAATSSGFYLGTFSKDKNISTYELSKSEELQDLICRYQTLQGSAANNAIVAGSSYSKGFLSLIDAKTDWEKVVEYVKGHKYDNKGNLIVDIMFVGYQAHAANFLYYKNVDDEDRIYVYDNNLPDNECYFCLYNGTITEFTSSGNIPFDYLDSIGLISSELYFKNVKSLDTRCVFLAPVGTISIDGATEYPFRTDSAKTGTMYESFEVVSGTKEVVIKPLVDNAYFEYMGQTYSFGDIDEDTTATLTLSTSEEKNNAKFTIDGKIVEPDNSSEPDEPDFSGFKIKNYSSTLSVDYKSTVIFHTTMDAPEGYEIVWSNNIKGSECKLNSVTDKEYKVSAKMVNKTTGEAEAVTEEVTVKVNTGFFAKIIAFFKGLFGSLPTYEDFKKK